MFDHIHHVAYVVDDMDRSIIVFRDTFELEFIGRQIIDSENKFEVATFKCGKTFIELLEPISHPSLQLFLDKQGPGLHHVAYAVKDLDSSITKLNEKGIDVKPPGAFVAVNDWNIAYFDQDNDDLVLFLNNYHGDHLAEDNEAIP